MTLMAKTCCALFISFFTLSTSYGDALAFNDTDFAVAKKEMIANQKPLILYVSHSTCPFCVRLDKEIMPAVVNTQGYTNMVTLQKLTWDSNIPVNWVNGEQRLPDEIVSHYKVRATPTLLFLNDKGEEIAKRIEGYRGADFYWVYLDKSIEQARLNLRGE